MARSSNVIELNMSPDTAKRIIKEIVEDSSSRVIFTTHAMERMAERRITRTQVFKCLMHGCVVEGPAPDIKGNMSLTMEVKSAGDVVSVVTALKRNSSGNFVIVITVFGA